MLLNSRPHTGTRAESLFIPGPGLDTLPRATQLTQRVTTCVTPLFSYAEHVEQMTWLIKKSHRSSAPSNTQGRDGARPPHSSEAAGPNPGPARGGAGCRPARAVWQTRRARGARPAWLTRSVGRAGHARSPGCAWSP